MTPKVTATPNADDPLFGEWRVSTDGRAHYFLAGRCLCGSGLAPTEEPVVMRTTRAGPGKGPAHNTASSHCAACMLRNAERWAGVAAESSEVTP